MNRSLFFLFILHIIWIDAIPKKKSRQHKQNGARNEAKGVQTGSIDPLPFCIVGALILFVLLVLGFCIYNKRKRANAIELPDDTTLTAVTPASAAQAASSSVSVFARNTVEAKAHASMVVSHPVNAVVAHSTVVPPATLLTAVPIALKSTATKVPPTAGNDGVVDVEMSESAHQSKSDPNLKTDLQASNLNWQSDPSASKVSSSWSLTDLEPYKKHVFKEESKEICGVCKSKEFTKTKKKANRRSCSRCKQVAHDVKKCKEELAKPCAERDGKPPSPPLQFNPLKLLAEHHHELFEIVPKNGAQVPAALIYCTATIEKKLGEEGMKASIYYGKMDDKKVKDFTDQLRYDLNFPSLTEFDPPFIASCVKRFLYKIKKRMVDEKELSALHAITKEFDQAKLFDFVMNLDNAEKDTLAHMMNHLQKLITNDEERHELARIFAPLLIIKLEKGEERNIDREVKAMEMMLRIDRNLWNTILLESSKH